jgi:hypothetical protein
MNIMEQQESQSQVSKPKINYVKDTFPEYLGKKDHISASDLKTFMLSPRKYYYEKFEKEYKEDERYFAVGSGLHEIILEPELFRTNYIIAPKFDRRTKDGKIQYEEFVQSSKGKTILFEDEMDMIVKMANNAVKNKTLMELLKDSHKELSCYTEDSKTGLKLKMRPDSISTTKSTITDIKSCLDASPKKFRNDVYSYGYSLSAAYYTDFLNRENYIFAAIEKQAPYQVSLFALQDEMIEYGRKQYRTGLDLLKWSMDNNYWCDYNEFQILLECYDLENLDTFFDTIERSEIISILK